MTIGHESTDHDPTQFAREILTRSQEALHRAVEIITPDTPAADPFTVLPETTELRADGKAQAYVAGVLQPLSAEQSASLREVAAELGFARPNDLTLSEQGIRGAHVIIEGGQPHKIWAEAMMVLEDPTATPSTLVFSASPHRTITSAGEKASAERLLGSVPESEYGAAEALASKLPGFVPLEDPVLSIGGYDLDENFTVSNETSGQFVHIGHVGRTPVVMMAIDHVMVDGQDRPRQPGVADIIKIISEISAGRGDTILPIAVVTSATYQPSRNVAGAKAALITGRQVGIATYGTERLNAITGEAAQPKRDDQLPGELYKMAKDTAALKAVLVLSAE